MPPHESQMSLADIPEAARPHDQTSPKGPKRDPSHVVR